MRRPIAYITAPWGENEFENTENAAKYCRAVYDAGFSPICPMLFLPLFLSDEIPQEHKDGIDMAREYLRRSHVLVVCGDTVDESMKNDIAVAERLRITATTLDGIEKLWKNYGMDIREWNCWPKLNECRLVTNTIKHSEGQSEEALRAVRAELFKFQNSIHNKEIDRLRLYHSTLSEVTLNITEQDLNDYADALIDFWRSIPVDQYMTIIS